MQRVIVPHDTEFFCSQDWGHNAPGVILWWACLPDGKYVIVREYKHQFEVAETVAKAWRRINRDLGLKRVRYVVGDPSMWAKTGHGRGESIAETLQRCGLPMRKGDNDRKNGWSRVHQLLRDAPDGMPWLTVGSECKYLIRSLPAQVSDPKDLDDLDTGGDDHAVDALRYGAMSRPSPTAKLLKSRVVPGTAGALLEDALRPAVKPLGAELVR